MKARLSYLVLGLLLCSVVAAEAKQKQTPKANIDYVNMLVGSDGPHVTEYGGTVPAVSEPFGMTQWVPATRGNFISRTMYRYCDKTLFGFQATHQPAIWMGDYGFMTIMPESGELKTGQGERAVAFSHEREHATPYRYDVSFESGNGKTVAVSYTATSRCSVFNIDYPLGEKSFLYIEGGRENEGGGVRILPDRNEVWVFNKEQQDRHLGPRLYNLAGYYVLRFSKPISSYGTVVSGVVKPGACEAAASSVAAYVEFGEDAGQVEVRCGSSFIDYAQAADNMDREIPSTASFEGIALQVRSKWSAYLDKIKLEGATEEEKALFYTSFFRTFQFPREFSEYGRYYSAFDDRIHEGVSYTAFSIWDTFRSEWPWLHIFAPERIDPMVQSLVQMYQEGGWLPKLPNPTYTNIMIGTHADILIASAYVAGFRGYDVHKAYEAVRKDAFTPPLNDESYRWGDRHFWNGCYEARGGLTNYLSKGFVASDITAESVARTLEFALDDYCIAQMADGLGKTADRDTLLSHAGNYRNLYDPESGFFRARRKDGSWDGGDVGFTEGANWTYRFCVMQDVPGMIEMMGGNERFVKALDDNFELGHYCHDNEPGHHYPYLYTFCGRLDKTQALVRRILEERYSLKPDGLCGNDDCGQMSSWYLFSSLGFYPMVPASGEYVLGIPKYSRAVISLPEGKTLVVKQDKSKSENKPNIYFNGKRIKSNSVLISELMKGGTLEFSEKPIKKYDK